MVSEQIKTENLQCVPNFLELIVVEASISLHMLRYNKLWLVKSMNIPFHFPLNYTREDGTWNMYLMPILILTNLLQYRATYFRVEIETKTGLIYLI